AIGADRLWLAGALIVLLAIIFVAIAAMLLEVVYAPTAAGDAPPAREPRAGRGPWLVVAPAALAVIVLALGLWIPSPLAAALSSAATTLGGHGP
ncbi:MAG TPA: hypothetical protein VHB25_20785, partial [Gemmatimonadaceae bacterium]|nr:hypothetical protein [Gemmatimonadaceae bacterium]